MKRIYNFELNKTIETEEPIIEKNEKGEEIKVLKKVTKEIPQKYFIRKINRTLQDSCRLFAGGQHAYAIQNGLMPAVLLQKRHIDDSGLFSEKEKELIKELREKTIAKQDRFTELSTTKEEDRTEEQKNELKNLINDLTDINSKMSELNDRKNAVYQNTAEGYVEEKVITWWILNLAYFINEKGEEKEFFGEGNYDKRIDKLDKIDESSDKLDKQALSLFIGLISYYILSSDQITDKELDIYYKLLLKNQELKDKE